MKIVYGTDLIGPLHRHQSLEFSIRGEVLPPIDVIRSTTSTAAELFNMTAEIGRVAVGLRADLLAIDGNPLDDLSLLQDQARLMMILKDGDIHKHDL